MSYLAGKIVLSVVAGAPNNGKGQQTTETPVKKTVIRGKTYPYVSAQAFRRWWRDTMAASGAEPSPVVRVGKAEGKAQKATTQGAPILYADDDLFGYMKTSKDKEGGTTVRDSPLMVGTFLSVEPGYPTSDFGVMARGVENPVLHSHEFYTADLAAPFLLDLPRVGTFTLPGQNGSGRANYLSEQAALGVAAAAQMGATTCVFRGQSALRLPLPVRRERVAVLLEALAELTGGAKKALHYGDRVPALIAMLPMAGGVNPLGFVIDGGEEQYSGLQVRAQALRDELAAWDGEWEAPVRLGWRPGFREQVRKEFETDAADLMDAGKVVIEHPRSMLLALAGQIRDGRHDAWFDDPAR
ncbi:type I-B CRISPR-associated protein Cas7/Cst2/DevR [Sphaerisporangium corydalis]|uniref:Type I-B CRISPR-associated protein Cas7/Cst2/DevR n=1 Tax=Sphaerisporangium corydalis TaxID=1441875 RepID=A0ABV9EMP3_9ACTN|nr:type I-B CRISPR-associated protein Cas7/Cst2/DevR [Sphaerisporangium corydalis]